jgi:hypothetical protein
LKPGAIDHVGIAVIVDHTPSAVDRIFRGAKDLEPSARKAEIIDGNIEDRPRVLFDGFEIFFLDCIPFPAGHCLIPNR